ncbi:MAG: NAD(P)/FAD-dependent oxidoreductase [Bacteroidota bacterium]
MSVQRTSVLIIGGGPGGLATAGCLRKAKVPFELLEKSQRVGNAWHEHYDRLHLHTVKELSHLPHLTFPEEYPQYVPKGLLTDYFEQYTQHFNIQPHFGQTVTEISKEGTKWQVQTKQGATWIADQVVVATGVNRVPNHPAFQDEADFGGQILHSRKYRNAKPFVGQRVLVIGMGNTGAEIALDLSESDIDTTISVRSPVNIVPRDVLGRPTQLTAQKLSKLPHWLGDWVGVQLRRFTVGDLTKYGLQTPAMPPAKQLRVTGKTPVIDIGTLTAIKAGRIKVMPGLDHFTTSGVVFKNGQERAFDTVILATGYRPKLEAFIPGIAPLLDQYGAPSKVMAPAPFEGLYFVGFDNYTAGGILGNIFRESGQVAGVIAGE